MELVTARYDHLSLLLLLPFLIRYCLDLLLCMIGTICFLSFFLSIHSQFSSFSPFTPPSSQYKLLPNSPWLYVYKRTYSYLTFFSLRYSLNSSPFQSPNFLWCVFTPSYFIKRHLTVLYTLSPLCQLKIPSRRLF